ncbi:barstar family protein [Bernardetia sp.]|uniref:barstar family protein n=1 Tax=Bernardetia sp. TaxID=1937974 RepID=UPI0025C29CAE|nr:barstar family protein [Bernardetia sp.]
MNLEIDFSKINDLESMHNSLKKKFGFPDFYGKNVNALIDCLTSLRYPEDGMTKVILKKEEVLNLTIYSMPYDNALVINHFFIAIQSVNSRYKITDDVPPINLILLD